MPSRAIYELFDELHDAIRAVRTELCVTNSAIDRLEQTFDKLVTGFRAENDKLQLGSNDVVQRFENEMQRLMAPFNERLSNSSTS